jgi:hypothetical protein
MSPLSLGNGYDEPSTDRQADGYPNNQIIGNSPKKKLQVNSI